MQAMYLLLAGVFVGTCSGLFGIGGGIVLVPILIFLFHYPQHMANGTSMVALLLPVGALGAMAYYKAGKITTDNIKLGLLVSMGMFLGTYLGAKLAIAVPDKYLGKAFALFLLGVAGKLWFKA